MHVMTSITIRNVPADTHAELSARASLAGRSLQEYLLGKLNEIARRPDPTVVLERIRARAEASGIQLSAEQILKDRDADRT